jgi:hypothetical protein
VHAAASDVDATITLAPAMRFLDARPGEQIRTSVLVQNQTGVAVAFVVDVTDMRAGPGADRAFDYVAVGDAPRGAGAWTSTPVSTFRLAPTTQREVDVVVDVPAEAGAGGHYAALLFTAREVNPTGQFQIDQLTPVPVLVTVAGEFERDLRATIKPDARLRWSGGRARWTVELRNDGDVHENVSGRVRFDALWSGSSSTPLGAGILLPGESRRQRIALDVRSAPDAFTADVRVELDDSEPETATAPRMWVLPIWLVIVGIVLSIVVWVRTRRPGTEAFEENENHWDPPLA